MTDVYQAFLDKAIALHKQEKYGEAEIIYNQLLNRMPFEEGITYLLADLYLRKDFNGLAINLLSNLLQNNAQHAAAWCNLGCAFRKENEYDRAKQAWLRAISVGGETVEVCNNFASLYADRANPQMALQWIEKSLKLEPENPKAMWGKALSLLSMKQWEEGWKCYEHRDRKSTRLNSSHIQKSRMPSSA